MWRDHQAHLGRINLKDNIISNKITNTEILCSIAKDIVDKEFDDNIHYNSI